MAIQIPFTKEMYDLLNESTSDGVFQKNIALYPVEIPLPLWDGLVKELGNEKAGLFINVMLVIGARQLLECHKSKFENIEKEKEL